MPMHMTVPTPVSRPHLVPGEIYDNNALYGAGGGIMAGHELNALIVKACNLYDNVGSYAGGGIYTSSHTSARIDDTVFTDNDAPSGTGCALHMTEAEHPVLDANRNPPFPGSRLKDNTFNSGRGKCNPNVGDIHGDSLETCCTSGTLLHLDNQIKFDCHAGNYMPQPPLKIHINEGNFKGCKFQCPMGSFGNSSDETSPTCSGNCPPGHYCPAGTSTPTPCPAGTFLEPPPVVGTSASSCLPYVSPPRIDPTTAVCAFGRNPCMCHACPATLLHALNRHCEQALCTRLPLTPVHCRAGRCTPGTFNSAPSLSATKCVSCPKGKLSENLRATSCQDCPVGGYCGAEGAAVLRQTYTPCPTGTYNPSTGSSDSAACITCPAGKANPIPGLSDDTACKPCLPGSYAASPGIGVCPLCDAGKYQDEAGQTACKPCTAGYLCVEGSSAPQPCPGGTHADQAVLAANGFLSNIASDCANCPAGTSCSVGSNKPQPCLPGSYAPVAKMETCLLCPAGQYQELYGQTACVACSRGSYCKEGSATPIPCPGGTSSNLTSRVSVGQCVLVPVDYWAPLGSSVPERCTSGFYCPGAAADKVMIPPGSKPIIQEVGGSTARVEVPVVKKEMRLDMSIDEFAVQREAMKAVLAAQYGVDPSQITLEASSSARRRLTSTGLQLVITIAVPEAASSGAASSSATSSAGVTVDSLLSKVTQIDDAVLGASLGAALGLPSLNVTTTAAAQTASVNRQVQFECPAGKWCTAGLVVDCPINTFNNETGKDSALACTRCPPNSRTLTLSATSIDECLCDRQHYDTLTGPGVECALCPLGTACNGVGATLDSLPIRPGFFRLGNESIDVLKCPDASLGCNDAPVCDNTTSGCLGGLNSEDSGLCRGNLSGVFCRTCPTDLGRRLHYSSATNTKDASCKPCVDNLGVTIGVGVAGLGLGLGLVLVLMRAYRDWVSSSKKDALVQGWKAFKPMNKLKILTGFYMIAVRIDSVYEVVLPYQVKNVINLLGNVFSIGLLGVGTPLECIGMRGFVYKLLAFLIAPVAASLLVTASAAGWLHFRRGGVTSRALMEAALPWTLRIFFLAYPAVTNVAFDAFPCYRICVGGELEGGRECEAQEFLKADVSVKCWSSADHTAIVWLAWAGIIIYPVGNIAVYAALLLRARHAITSQRPTTLSRSIEFLHEEYEVRAHHPSASHAAHRSLIHRGPAMGTRS